MPLTGTDSVAGGASTTTELDMFVVLRKPVLQDRLSAPNSSTPGRKKSLADIDSAPSPAGVRLAESGVAWAVTGRDASIRSDKIVKKKAHGSSS